MIGWGVIGDCHATKTKIFLPHPFAIHSSMVHYSCVNALLGYCHELPQSDQCWVYDANQKPMNFNNLFTQCKPHTMTCRTRMRALYDSIIRVHDNEVPGDLAETGVWMGGNILLMAMMCKRIGSDKTIWAYDTFEGMPDPGRHDLRHDGKKPDFSSRNNLIAPIDLVSATVKKSGYDNVRFVKGKIEDTIPGNIPQKIALLRTDTDFYSSTKHTLSHLHPLISPGGVFINDDYYHFEGAKRAVDEYEIAFERIGNTNAIISYI